MPEGQVQQGMMCPVCHVDLHMTNREGVEIDYCPRCRGVWLDRGELDKIVERSAGMDRGPLRQAGYQDDRARYRDDRRRRGDDDEGGGWLDNIFNFGD